MKKKRRKTMIMALWVIFLLMVTMIAFLSFQNGEDAKRFGDRIILYLAGLFFDETMTKKEIESVIYQVRQYGRAVAFLLIGIVGTITIHVSCPKCNWGMKTGITAFILLAIAFFTERLKIYIPSRHYSYEEMLISIMAVTVGFLAVSAITLTTKALKGLLITLFG